MEKFVFPGSFDPIQNGHVDLLQKLVELYPESEIIIAIGENYDKRPDFTVKERKEMIRRAISVHPKLQRVKIDSYKGSLSGYAYKNMATVVRGIRDNRDYYYEKDLITALESQELGIRTLPLNARDEMSGIRSSFVREYQKSQMSIAKSVHPYVKQCVEARISGQYIIGITGSSGAGKSHIRREVERIGREKGFEVIGIDLDRIPHNMYDGTYKEPIYAEVRRQIVKEFGKEVELPDGKINRKKLGDIVFNDPEKLKKLNEIVYTPMMARLRDELYGKRGLFLIDAALAVELGLTYLSNNNFILVDADRATQEKRLKERSLTEEQIRRRLDSQYNTTQKREILQREIEKYKHGTIWEVNNSEGEDLQLDSLFNQIIRQMDMHGELRFVSLWNRLNADGSPYKVYADLLSALTEPHRNHHDINHIVECLDEFELCKHLMERPNQVELALWFHEYFYKPRTRVNEEESAKKVYNVCMDARLPENFALSTKKLVMVTKDHGAQPLESMDEKCVSDIDLSILGKPQERFDEYDRAIAEEFSWVEPEVYRQNRTHVLEGFLRRENIYHTGLFRGIYEAQARMNLQRAIDRLRSS